MEASVNSQLKIEKELAKRKQMLELFLRFASVKINIIKQNSIVQSCQDNKYKAYFFDMPNRIKLTLLYLQIIKIRKGKITWNSAFQLQTHIIKLGLPDSTKIVENLQPHKMNVFRAKFHESTYIFLFTAHFDVIIMVYNMVNQFENFSSFTRSQVVL